MRGTFVDEVPQEFHKERKAAAARILEATEQALPTVQAVMADDATADLSSEAVEALLVLLQDRVKQAFGSTRASSPDRASLSRPREAITTWTRAPIARGGSSPRRLLAEAQCKGEGKGKSETPLAPGQQPDAQPSTPQHFNISDAFGADAGHGG